MLFTQRNHPVRGEKAAAKIEFVDLLSTRSGNAAGRKFDPIDAIAGFQGRQHDYRSARENSRRNIGQLAEINSAARAIVDVVFGELREINRGGLTSECDSRRERQTT